MSSIDEQIQQVISFLEHKANKHLSRKELFALIYLADRYHLRKHGRFIIGGNVIPNPVEYVMIDKSLPPINVLVAKYFGMHPEHKEMFLIEMDLVQ